MSKNMSRSQKNKRALQRQITNRNREPVVVKPKSWNQSRYLMSMIENDITFCLGPAGSGKSSVAVGLACNWLQDNKIERIVITRPTVETGGTLGLLPGSADDKMNPYVMPIIEEMHKYIGKEMTSKLRESGMIELCPLQLMRGRNFHKCFMILDEAQNATFEQIKMFITRIGMNSRAVINGDIEQTDLPKHLQGGLTHVMSRVNGVPGVGLCQLDSSDIVRHPIIGAILERLK